MKKSEFNYIWYPLTSFMEKSNSEINYRIPDVISPYMELNLENITNLECEIEKSEIVDIDVNPYFRFEDIFFYLTNPDNENNDYQVKEVLHNIVFHFLGEMDLYLGQCKKDIIIKEIVKDIEGGSLGREAAIEFNLFKRYEKVIIGEVFYGMNNSVDMIESFKHAIKLLYRDSIIYDNQYSLTNLVVYLNYKEKENSDKFQLLKRLFLPLGMEVDVFWEKHFAVIDVPETCIIGEMVIF